jgi:hypothetical protein
MRIDRRLPEFFRLWCCVDFNVGELGCWERRATQCCGGYTQLKAVVDGRHKRELAHRWVYRRYRGPIPEGLEVRHLCHNACCVNPDHLAIGTHTENMQDSVRAGRRPFGETTWCAKLTDEDVAEIRRLYAAGGISQPALAKRYGVNNSVICRAIAGKTWRHVPMKEKAKEAAA